MIRWQRKDIVNGTVEPTDEECELAEDDESEEDDDDQDDLPVSYVNIYKFVVH